MKLVAISLLALVLGVGLGWKPAQRAGTPAVEVGEPTVLRESVVATGAESEAPESGSWTTRIRGAKTLSDLEKVYGEMKDGGVRLNQLLRWELARRWVEIEPEGGIVFLRQDRRDDEDRMVLGALFAEWMVRDFDVAFARFTLFSDNAVYREVLTDLLRRDVPDLCIAFLRELRPFWLHEVASDPRWLTVARERTREFSDALVRWDGAASSFTRRQVLPLVQFLGDSLYEAGPEEALAWMAEMPDRLKMAGLERVLIRWAEDDVTAVLRYLDAWKESGAESDKLVSSLLRGNLNRHLAAALAKRDLPEAITWVGEHGNSVGRSGLLRVVAERLAEGEIPVDEVYEEMFLNNASIHAHGFADALSGVWRFTSGAQKLEMLEALQGKEAGPAKETAISGLMKSWVRRRPDEAGAAMARIPAGPERDELLRDVLRGMVDHYNHVRMGADFVAAVPKEHRAAAVEAYYLSEPDPEKWGIHSVYPGVLAEGLEEVPNAEGRLRAMRQVGAYWGTMDPEKALEWAGGLQGMERWETTTAVVRGWAGQDMWAVANRLESLPRGRERDATTRGLAVYASREDPEAAWMWCGEIEDGAARRATRKEVMQAWGATDGPAAREALDGADLGADEREALRAVLKP